MKQKSVTDYSEQLSKLYPDVPLSEIKKIINYGWRLFYLYNSFGCDVLLSKLDIWLYCGNCTNDSLKHFNYYARKLALKVKLYHKTFRIPWDGYYYFSLTPNLYNELLKLVKGVGRKRKKFTFKNILLYRLKDVCILYHFDNPYIYRLPITFMKGLIMYYDTLTTDKAELIITKPCLKFKDLMEINKKYKFDYAKHD